MEHSGIERARIGHRHPPGRVRVGNFGNLVLPEVRADPLWPRSTTAATWSGRRFAWSTQTWRFPRSAVRASRGKVVRAEPVAALYQQGRVHHIGTFPQLEDQMTNFTSDIDRAAGGVFAGPR